MSNVLGELEPKALWRIFEEMCQVPRPSKHEDKIQEYAVEFGERLGLETFKDEIGNIIIRKKATKGMENRKAIILQGHLDMVPQKNSDKQHDFETDPIEPFIDDNWVKAKGTTLGSDNGIGVAAALAILESDDIPHPALEALLTADEETGMTGAHGLKAGILKGDILINMDSEDEGELFIGCAGGVDTIAKFPYSKTEIPDNYVPYKINVIGLKGGHSGLDIHLGRGNANKILNKLLMEASEKCDLRITEIDGGGLRNAIPREAFAIVVVKGDSKEGFESLVENYERDIKPAFKEADPDLKVNIESVEMPEFVIDKESQGNILNAVDECPNGVIAYNKDMPEVVETSTNMGIVKSVGDTIEVTTLQRGAVDKDKEDIAQKIYDIFKKHGGNTEFSGNYPGWKPNVNSPILKEMKKNYEKLFGEVPAVKVIHAGLECGILGDKYPDWDMISFGPTIRNPHSPNEMVNIATVQKFWDLLLETLRNIPVKQ